ncbi:ATP synthase F1 subcomplex gamma subunit [Bacteroidales bacterium 6E]|nr:ATP synthase F1 subcomplex gamma subunit [Bacteroidales bacterium 6E]
MAGLKEIRTRITSIKTTRQVTSAMKMVSAAKLKKAQDAIINFRPYANRLQEIMEQVAGSLKEENISPYCAARESGNILLVIVTSNRGLCGGFNSNIIRKFQELLSTKYSEAFASGKVKVMSVGKQGERQLKSARIKVDFSANDVWDSFSYAEVESLAKRLLKDFENGVFDKVEIIYNEFVNAAMQRPIVQEFLPVKIHEADNIGDEGLVLYEPSRASIAMEMIPRMLRTQFYKAMLDSWAAEHGARMTAMHMATDNATDLINELTLVYNKARQASITKEILEISAGAEALRG